MFPQLGFLGGQGRIAGSHAVSYFSIVHSGSGMPDRCNLGFVWRGWWGGVLHCSVYRLFRPHQSKLRSCCHIPGHGLSCGRLGCSQCLCLGRSRNGKYVACSNLGRDDSASLAIDDWIAAGPTHGIYGWSRAPTQMDVHHFVGHHRTCQKDIAADAPYHGLRG